MHEIQLLTLNKAIAMLKASGVRYAVETEPGVFVGSLEVKPPRPVKPVRTPRHQWEKLNPYIDKVSKLLPGEVLTFDMPAEHANSFQSAVCGTACRLFGVGNYTTGRTKTGKLELLRVS